MGVLEKGPKFSPFPNNFELFLQQIIELQKLFSN